MTPATIARPDEWSAALKLFHGQLPSPAREHQVLKSLGLLTSREIPPEGLLVLRDGVKISGAQLAVPLAGAAGLMFPPRLRGEADLERENLLVRAGLDFLKDRGARVVHAILPDLSGAAPLIRGGLEPITHLFYFQHDLQRLPSLPDRDWHLAPFDPMDPSPFQETLMRTYEGSLDCPELNDTRTAEEILAGHRAQGNFRPDRWRLARAGGEAVGLILLMDLKEEPAWDLAYLGVVPEHRKHGWGKALTTWGMHAARQAGAQGLQVAVDERNEPALGLYRGLGFVETGRRVALLKKFA